jgi:hypothetical protein
MASNPADEMTESLRSRGSEGAPSETVAKEVGMEVREERRTLDLVILFMVGSIGSGLCVLIMGSMSEEL